MQFFELQGADYDEAYSNGTTNGNVDQAFKKITKTSTWFQIWRIENMNVIAVPKDQYGTFFDTDSYIIYSASQSDQSPGIDTVQREVKGSLEFHVHFWLGSNTTPDKSGVAAYKSVELDGYLGFCTTQHRETQGNESSRFLSYFKNGLRILKSDLIANGNGFHPKLYKIKGKRTPVLAEMANISWSHFNSSDVFLIHTARFFFVWIGRASNAVEKIHGAKLALEMRGEGQASSIVFVDDGYENTLSPEEKKEFNSYLPLDKRMVLPENGNEEEIASRAHIKLYKCSENGGKYRVAELKNGPLEQTDLCTEDVYIIDHEVNGIWVWAGRRSTDKEKSEALRNARGFVKKKKYSNNTKVTRVIEGFEPTEFKLLFTAWKNDKSGKSTKAKLLVSKFDAETLEERPGLAAETQLIDDGSGTVTIWRVKEAGLVEVPKERHGIFFSGDCYIILYSYQTPEQKYLLYCWLGSHASQEEVNTATVKLNEIENGLGKLGFQARLIQGRETAHFLQLFKGRLVVFKGRGIDFDDSGKNLKNSTHYLLQIFGSTLYSSKAVQVNLKASSLNSNFCFVLKRGKKAHVWCGNYSTGDQREMAKLFAGKDFELVLEGKEKDDFFNLLGGKGSYNTQMQKIDFDPRPPRLLHCVSASKSFRVEEIMFFSQKDLVPEQIMLLDTHEALYIWIGKLSSREDQRLSIQMAIDYLQSDPSGRDMNIAIIHIKQDMEPPTFKGFFPTWDRKFWKNYKSFGKLRNDIEVTDTNSNGKVKNGFSGEKSGHSDFDQYDKYPINILKEPNEKLPSRVDPLNKELHLTHDDFVSLFKMRYLDFEKLPRWKQQEMKKKAGLF